MNTDLDAVFISNNSIYIIQCTLDLLVDVPVLRTSQSRAYSKFIWYQNRYDANILNIFGK